MAKTHKNPDQGIWKHIFRYLVKITCWPSAILYFKPKYYYEDKKVQKRKIKGKAIIISNHLGGTDIVVYTIVFIRRYLRFIAGEEAFIMNKFQSFFLKSFGAIKVVRASMQQDYIYQSINTLNRGGVIQIYPEAHFPSTKDHRLQPFKSSYIVMAAQTGAPIIPCYHNANYGLFKRDHVAIGKPIYTKDYFVSSNPTIEQIGLMNKAIESKVRELQKVIEG